MPRLAAPLAAHREGICVSIYIPTTPLSQETAHDRIELKNMVKSAEQQLHDAGADKREIAATVEHIDDLIDLVELQLGEPEGWRGVTANVGGGRDGSLSLLEATALCRELTGKQVPIGSEPENRPGDVPIYLSDCARLYSLTSWRPKRSPRETLADLLDWVVEHEDALRVALNFDG